MPSYHVLLSLEDGDRVLEITVTATDAASAALIASDTLAERIDWRIRQVWVRRAE